MKIFKYIRDWLTKSGINPTYVPKHDAVGFNTPDTVKEDEQKAIRERVRKSFSQQEREIMIRASKPHSMSCPDNWTCTKNPCFIPVPDIIVVHDKDCVHANGIIMGLQWCECN